MTTSFKITHVAQMTINDGIANDSVANDVSPPQPQPQPQP